MSALSDGERLERALACVPGWTRGLADLEVVALAGGTANRTYRIRTPRGEFALRLHAPERMLLGVDGASELRLHEAAARAGIAPPLIAADPAGAFLITRYVRGRAWQENDMAEPTHLSELARRLRALHALPMPQGAVPYEPARLIRAHAERIARADPAAASQLKSWVARAQAIVAESASAGRPPGIIHNDLHHSNILQARGEVYLIDWEYAAVADPLFDLACLLAYYPAASAHAPLLLAEAGLAGTALAALHEASWLHVLLSYLWYRVLALQSPPSAASLIEEQRLRERLLQAASRGVS